MRKSSLFKSFFYCYVFLWKPHVLSEWLTEILSYTQHRERAKFFYWFSFTFLLKRKVTKVQDTAIFSAHCGKRRKYGRRDELFDFETQALLPISFVVSLVSSVTRSAPCRACTLRLFKAICFFEGAGRSFLFYYLMIPLLVKIVFLSTIHSSLIRKWITLLSIWRFLSDSSYKISLFINFLGYVWDFFEFAKTD